MNFEAATLGELRADFLAGSTNSLPIAGAISWAALGLAALELAPRTVGTLALYIMMAILPVAFLLDRLKGRNFLGGGRANPLTRLFLVSVTGIALTVPLVVMAANAANDPVIVVLGMAILAGVIWIPYGWAAGDPVGLQHAIGRGVLCYLAYALVDPPFRASAICAAVVLSYIYSLLRMKQELGGSR